MSLNEADRPHFLIIAGPNGSGKSSAYQASVAEISGRSFRIINPDLFTARLLAADHPTENANLEAVERIEQWIETSLLAGHTIGVETVLSTPKYRRLVTLAKRLGYRVQLIYVILDDPRRNVERVRIRYKRGGHDVPEDKIISRYGALSDNSPGSSPRPMRHGCGTIRALRSAPSGKRRAGKFGLTRKRLRRSVAPFARQHK